MSDPYPFQAKVARSPLAGVQSAALDEKPHEFQVKVARFLLAGRSVILQAPTGSGKTRAALLPYIDARFKHAPYDFPRRCVYSVPMRVLANQFEAEFKNQYEEFASRHLPVSELDPDKLVRVQTGERAEDRKFEGEIIFTTIDQALSSFLAVPYSLSNSEANINVAAIFGSYLVFDEFHLFPQEASGNGALATTIEMLRWLKGITPFVLMTATFSGVMLDHLCEMLDAEKVVLSPAELTALRSQHKTRTYRTVDSTLDATAVLAAHGTRSIAICNTVARAQQLYRELQQASRDNPNGTEITIKLLHSRFTKEHRGEKEEWARAEFGKDKSKKKERSAIIVATQVVEVGLDMTCENLHTELAHANSILQRAGRCARYFGEEGEVRIYKLPTSEKDNSPQVLPYSADLCNRTWQAFSDDERQGKALGYAQELEVVDLVHTEEDRAMLELLSNSRGALQSRMEGTINLPDRSVARGYAPELIRRVSSITLVVHPHPDRNSVPDPWAFEGFSMFRYSVENQDRVNQLLARAAELDLDQALWVPVARDDKTENSRQPIEYDWRTVTTVGHIKGQPLLFIHPALAAYDEEIGFRIVLNDGDMSGGFQSKEVIRSGGSRSNYSYVAESYGCHIGHLRTVYKKGLRDEIAWASRRLELTIGLPEQMVDRAIRLALGCHDLGKMTVAWQDWAHDWQKRVGHPQSDTLMLAHTFYDPSNSEHQVLNRKYGGGRPHHAVEGAIAANRLIYQAVGGNIIVCRAVVSAIARHHNADSTEATKFCLDRNAERTLQQVLDELARGRDWRADASLVLSKTEISQSLTEDSGLTRQGDNLGTLLYFLVVRILRLSDQGAVELANK